jgi:nicotinamide riboside transporter PnuC
MTFLKSPDSLTHPVCMYVYIYIYIYIYCRFQWPRGLRRRSAAVRLLRSCVRIPPKAWMFVCCECCVLSGRVLCEELITRPEKSYRLWCVDVCDLETSRMRRP